MALFCPGCCLYHHRCRWHSAPGHHRQVLWPGQGVLPWYHSQGKSSHLGVTAGAIHGCDCWCYLWVWLLVLSMGMTAGAIHGCDCWCYLWVWLLVLSMGVTAGAIYGCDCWCYLQGSHTTGKTGKVREIEYCAPGPGKVLKLDKCGQSPGKVREKETGAVPHF